MATTAGSSLTMLGSMLEAPCMGELKYVRMDAVIFLRSFVGIDNCMNADDKLFLQVTKSFTYTLPDQNKKTLHEALWEVNVVARRIERLRAMLNEWPRAEDPVLAVPLSAFGGECVELGRKFRKWKDELSDIDFEIREMQLQKLR
ncbi:MAG: hypothetical protein Q9226_002829 [Calogaya cf. arnoldii]